jgi:hypothetical protein
MSDLPNLDRPVAATETLTSYHLDRSRGRAAIDEFEVLDGFAWTLVHDAWASYNGYTGCDYAFCGAHIARELVAAGATRGTACWTSFIDSPGSRTATAPASKVWAAVTAATSAAAISCRRDVRFRPR